MKPKQDMKHSKTEKPVAPPLRFPGFTEDWEQRKLGEIYTERNERGNDALQILSVSIHTGVSDGELDADTLGKVVRRSEDKSTYKHVYSGDLIFNMMRAWQGAIGVAKNEGMISPAYISAIPSKDVYPPFMNYLLRRKDAINQINNLSYGVTDFRKRLYWDSFARVTCKLPSMAEQRQITEIFENLDNLITLHQRKLDAMKTYKKGLLQKMFPKKGATVPEIRFPGFTGDWEQRKLVECFEFLQNNTLSRAELSTETGSAINVHYGDVLIKFGEYLDVSSEQMAYIQDQRIIDKFKNSFLVDGDVVMADTAEDEAVGKCSEIAGLSGNPVISGLHTIPLRPNRKFAPGFLGYYMNSDAYHDQLLPLMQGTKVTSVSKNAIQNTDISYPVDIAEQAAIGQYFIRLDSLITLHQRKLDEMKEYKKGLLQKMFI